MRLFTSLLIDGFFFYGIITIALVAYAKHRKKRYLQSDYYAVTQKPWDITRHDPGSLGEYKVFRALSDYSKDGGRFLFNCYIPKANGTTTEVDIIMIHKTGIYVFESKNYSGWIFGSANDVYWTQTFKTTKNRFYNPIKQNDAHINQIKNMLGADTTTHSIIVFSNRCVLRSIDIGRSGAYITQLSYLSSVINEISSRMAPRYDDSTITAFYNKLYPYTQVSDDVKQRHIQNIHPSGTVSSPAYRSKGNVILFRPRRRH